jgi:MFS transporter, PPP family, 3-phenylpropionic acid transporter
VSRLRLLFVLNGVAVAVALPFGSVILADRGFEPAAIGVVIALTSVATVVSVSSLGHLGDVVLGRARAVQLAVLAAVGFLALFTLPLPAVVVGAAWVAYASVFGAVAPLSDALAVNAMPDPARGYGRIRALMSASFAVASVALGIVYGLQGYGPAVVLFGAVAVATAVVAGRVPDLGRATLTVRRRGGAIREAFGVQPALPLVLAAIGLVYTGVLAGFTFLPLRIVELGGGAPEVALASAVSAGVEIGAMVVAGRLVPRAGLRAVFAGSALLYALALASWAVLPTPAAIIVSRPVSGVGYAGLWIAGVMTIQHLLPARLQGSGQSLFTITATGVAGVAANVGGGLVYGGFGAAALFGVAALAALAGAIVGWAALPRGGARGARAEPGTADAA